MGFERQGRTIRKAILLGLFLAPLAIDAGHAADRGAAKSDPISLPADWLDTLTIDGFLDGGVALNPALPANGLNFGQYYTDRANAPQLNQSVITVHRPLNPNATGIDYGFKFQGMFGTDVRYTEYLGQADYLIKGRAQVTIVEANVQAHLPILTKGGVDVKIGQFGTYNGTEVFPSKDNIFYTHIYSYNFGPFLHTGAMTIANVNDWLKFYAGITSGIDTWLGWPGDNNNSPSFHGGFSVSLLNDNLTIMGITHSGPENADVKDPYHVGWPNGVVGGIPVACACNPTYTWRYYNNLMATWKATENLTFITDMNYYREDGWNPLSVTGLPAYALNPLGGARGFDPALVPQRAQGADAYGVTQYAIYKLNDLVRLGARIEFWRDNKNFFAAAYPGYFDNANSLHGFPAMVISRPAGQGTSYLALTAGATITPKFEGAPFLSGLIMRPELRWDAAMNNAAPFFGSGGPKRTQGLILFDVMLPFVLR